jgi:membrane protease YdiL (CAAX protease family)
MQSKHEAALVPFFVLVFALFIPFWVLGEIYSIELLPGLPLSALGAFMPALAALILTYRQDRFSGVRRLLGRCFDFKRIKNLLWFLLLLLIPPAIAVFAYGIICLSGVSLPDFTPRTLSIVPLFVVFFIAALGEEIGWTGYATEPLVQRWGLLTGSLVLGVIWAAVHFIPLTQAHRSVEWIAWWSLGTLSYRVIMTWLYVHSGRSLFGAGAFHAMINLSWQLFPNNGSHYDPRVFGLIAFTFAIALYALEHFLSRYRRRFTKFRRRISG